MMADKQKRNLIPASKWNEHHPWPPPGGLRHLIFNAAENGFDKCIKRVGRTVLIDEDVFFDCVDEQGSAKQQKSSNVRGNGTG